MVRNVQKSRTTETTHLQNLQNLTSLLTFSRHFWVSVVRKFLDSQYALQNPTHVILIKIRGTGIRQWVRGLSQAVRLDKMPPPPPSTAVRPRRSWLLWHMALYLSPSIYSVVKPTSLKTINKCCCYILYTFTQSLFSVSPSCLCPHCSWRFCRTVVAAIAHAQF